MIPSPERRFGRSSILWPVGGQGLFSIVNFVTSLWFARIAGPQTFGAYVFALTVIASISVSVDLCVQSALLTAPRWDDSQAFAWSILSTVAGSAAAISVFFVAAASVNGEGGQILGWLLLVSCMPLQAATQVPRARLVLNRDQLSLAVVDSVAAAVGAGVSLTAMQVYPSFASLCLFTPVVALLRWALLIRFHPAKRSLSVQQWKESVQSVRQAMRGFYLLQLSSFVSRNLDNLVVGFILGAGPLAFYSRAYSLFMGPLVQGQIALSSLSIAQIAKDRSAFRSLGLRLSAIVMPIVVFALFHGDIIVSLLLGPAWIEVSRLLPAFMFAAALLTFSQPCRWLLQSGRHHRRMNADAAMQLVLVVAAALGALFGDVQTAAYCVGFAAAPILCVVEWWLVWRLNPQKDFWVLLLFVVAIGAISSMIEWLIAFLEIAGIMGVFVGAALALCVALIALFFAEYGRRKVDAPK
jgi:O-antigen/teichoic acid export membrane protein